MLVTYRDYSPRVIHNPAEKRDEDEVEQPPLFPHPDTTTEPPF